MAKLNANMPLTEQKNQRIHNSGRLKACMCFGLLLGMCWSFQQSVVYWKLNSRKTLQVVRFHLVY